MEPVRERPIAVAPDSKKARMGGAIIEYPLFQKVFENLKTIDGLDNLVVNWVSRKLVAIHLHRSSYYSTCFKKPNKPTNDKYIYFYDGGTIDIKKIILGIRAHIHSKSGEILTIKKSDAMRGTEVLELGIALLKKLKIQRTYLHDASSFQFAEGISFFMRVYVPLISPDGKSWYGKHKFFPLLCRNMEGAPNLDAETEEERKAPIYNQDPNFYNEAVNYLREFSVSVLIDEVITDSKEKEEIRIIAVQHSATTVHQLALSAFNESDKAHFIRFNQIALSLPPIGEGGSINKVKYNIALDCLYSTKIFVLGETESKIAVPDFDEMTKTLPGQVVSYNDFILDSSIVP